MHPIIGITAGDPAGIGMEVVLKALPVVLGSARCVLFADRSNFERNAAIFPAHFPRRWIRSWDDVSDESIVFLRDLGGDTSSITWGELSKHAGARALAYLEAASDAALNGRIDAIVTAPVNKAAIASGFRGQTDFLAARATRSQYAMAFFAPTLKVVLATIHLSLREALAQISTDLYVNLIHFVDSEMRRFGFKQRRIAVAAINPHAGEGGIFGHEDESILQPAVQRCASSGISVTGPHSADSLYYWAHTGGCDVVIAPYHDQGLIPVKLIAHGQATNVTLGLPYVRTSPDHGTAFPIAGKGEADHSGMKTAIECAVDLVKRAAAINS
jgi:4-hydroxythreonine-4-phosphate dehydrogenase